MDARVGIKEMVAMSLILHSQPQPSRERNENLDRKTGEEVRVHVRARKLHASARDGKIGRIGRGSVMSGLE